MSNIIKELTKYNIHPYGSKELLKFEKNMEKYFTREYDRWKDNKALPEDYGISSFEGEIANKETNAQSIDHYNKELKIYQAFLDKKYMVYTMGYYNVTHEKPEIDQTISLHDAQINKFNLIIKRAQIKNGQSILDMGCGFAGFSKYLLNRFPDITITAINPSSVQTSHLCNISRFCLIKKFFDEITVKDIPSNSFDRVISVGVLEHVTNFDKLFKLISRVLKPGGKTFHHLIVAADTIPSFLSAEKTLMSNYFPGGHVWPYNELKRHNVHLKFVNSWFINGMNYWKTLDVWHQQFWDTIDTLYPEYLTLEEVEDWNKYFSLCKTMFNPNGGSSYGNGHYLYEKE